MIKFGIIGFGYIGKRYLEEITAQYPKAIVSVVIDIDESKLDEASKKGIKTFTGLQESLDNDSFCDIYVVSTPNGSHYKISKEVLIISKPVILEKPITINSLQAKELIELSQKNNVPIYPMLQNRYSPSISLLKEVLYNNALGKIFHCQISCYWNRDDRYYFPKTWRGTKDQDGGTLYTQFSHFLDIVCWLLGKPKVTSAFGYNHNHKHSIEFEDTAIVSMEWGSGTSGVLTYSTSVYNSNLESSFTLIGERGTIKISGQYMEKLECFQVKGYDSVPELSFTAQPNLYPSGYQGSANLHGLVLQNVINHLNNEEASIPLVSEALVSVELIEEIYNKMHSKK